MMLSSKNLVLFSITIINHYLQHVYCDRNTDCKVYEELIRVFRILPTNFYSTLHSVLNDTEKRVSSKMKDYTLSTPIRTLEHLQFKSDSLKCSYGLVVFKMLEHLQSIHSTWKHYAVLYDLYVHRILSVLYVSNISIPPTLWHTAVALSVSIQNGNNDIYRLYKRSKLTVLKNYLAKCMTNNYLPLISLETKLSSHQLGIETKKLYDEMKLSKDDSYELATIYNNGFKLNINNVYSKILNHHKFLLLPGKFCAYDFYDQKEYWNVLTTCVELVRNKWLSDFTVIFLYTNFIKNTLLMLTSFVVLKHCIYIQNILFDKSVFLGSLSDNISDIIKSSDHILKPAIDTVNAVGKILDVKDQPFFELVNTHWTANNAETQKHMCPLDFKVIHFIENSLRETNEMK
ncbi:uncharacterized protein LOC126895623 [Daktulosphaira vitifoliae]|uniref:uncharacterized protein LOC126895623 n=1 Tax=Daktulosphaira vitifoliae TaxID=58002 RepID=UPI0021AA4563|nr:uncharacterized protein LOC126895623 [Daktulosphaira vitifoliae]